MIPVTLAPRLPASAGPCPPAPYRSTLNLLIPAEGVKDSLEPLYSYRKYPGSRFSSVSILKACIKYPSVCRVLVSQNNSIEFVVIAPKVTLTALFTVPLSPICFSVVFILKFILKCLNFE